MQLSNLHVRQFASDKHCLWRNLRQSPESAKFISNDCNVANLFDVQAVCEFEVHAENLVVNSRIICLQQTARRKTSNRGDVIVMID